MGLNYRSHAEESGMAVPEVPATFTKFPASLGGPFDDIEIVGDTVDWEVELVAVIGPRADRAAEADGWSHVAGLTVGQDISDRTLQFAAGAQFSMGKSMVKMLLGPPTRGRLRRGAPPPGGEDHVAIVKARARTCRCASTCSSAMNWCPNSGPRRE